MIVLGYMDLNLAIWIEPPTTLFDSSTTKESIYYEKWEHSNCMSLLMMKHAILSCIRFLALLAVFSFRKLIQNNGLS